MCSPAREKPMTREDAITGMQRKNHQGLSLLELVVMAAIIGITSAIAVPSLMVQIRSYRLDVAAQQVT